MKLLYHLLFLPLVVPSITEEYTLTQIHHHGVDFPKLFRQIKIDGDPFSISFSPPKNIPYTHTLKRIPRKISNVTRLFNIKNKKQKPIKLDIQRTIPNITDKGTILTLAKMSFNAYIEPGKDTWLDMGEEIHTINHFGWEKDGIRGYTFANKDNSSIVVAFKGTSAGLVSGDSKTSAKDKKNDNLLFSCCCARVDQTWYNVCDCYKGSNLCSLTCVEESLKKTDEDIYYYAAQRILIDIEDQYPNADIWLTGHSLGGGLAALLGWTYRLPTVTFQSPGEKRASKRLSLPISHIDGIDDDYIWHFGHNSDPIFMGECQGVLSACYLGGYAMESKCHSGKVCLYDTKKELNWGTDILKHRIGVVLQEVIDKLDVPKCKYEDSNCQDCNAWEYRHGI